MKPLVFLVHGFLRTGASMLPMAVGLRREGFDTHAVTQVNLHRDIPALADLLFSTVERAREDVAHATGSRPDAHFVTHSMGGIVVRSMLDRHEISGPNRVVMLAPPNQGSRVAAYWYDSVLRFPWGRFDPLHKLLPGERGQCATAGDPDAEFGVIAGVQPGKRDDGKVYVDEARWAHARDFLVVPFGHTFIMARPRVIAQTAAFLRNGRFDAPAQGERAPRTTQATPASVAST
jgi:triacylglycerol lipase